jgi:hypothetical protein
MLSPGTAVLLAAEFSRAGDPDLGAAILERDVGHWLPTDAVFSFVRTGEKHPNFWRLDPELRAALAFVRARHLASRGEPSADLLAEAESNDLFKAVVSRAMASWPPVAPPVPAGNAGKNPEKGAKVSGLVFAKMDNTQNPGGGLRRVPRPAP